MAYAILQDMSLCMECQACRVACQAQNGLQPRESYVRFRFVDVGTYPNVTHHVARLTCLHCVDAACANACPTGATFKGESGLTHFNPGRCVGCGACVESCPFDISQMKGRDASRCTGCAELTENGQAPACVATCVANALSYGPRDEMLKKAEARVKVLKARFPNAQIYSPAGVGGTNLIWVLRDRPEVYGLPANPTTDLSLGLWKETVAAGGSIQLGAAALLGGLGWLISRREQLKAAETRGK